jgi:hypothetical protein
MKKVNIDSSTGTERSVNNDKACNQKLQALSLL